VQSTDKRACVYRHNFTWTKSQLFVEVILILKWFGWINWREFLNPQSNPQHAVSCAIFNDLSGCHGRGREFESRRPRHSFQRSCFNFGQTIEDAKRPRVAALSRPFCALFFCYMAAASCVVEPNDSEVSEEKTNDSTAACASCFAGLIAWV
jgi:hypothetical protein